MSNMKTATVREVQHGLASVLSKVQAGQEIAVTKRGKIIARIVPALRTKMPLRWPDSAVRMKRLMSGTTVKGMTPSEVVRELRGERL
jgi:prevent-host-death family protein